jgi:hypothetical protein
MLSCENRNKEYRITSIVKGMEVSKGYSYGDASDSVSYYLRYNGKRYLKKEILLFNNEGNIDSVHVFKADGIVGYSSKGLKSDSLLVRSAGWGITNLVKIKNDSLVSPFKAIVLELNTVTKKIYSLNKSDDHIFLYLMDYH